MPTSKVGERANIRESNFQRGYLFGGVIRDNQGIIALEDLGITARVKR